MKAILLTTLVATCFFAQAQKKRLPVNSTKKLSFSVEAGGNISTISGNNLSVFQYFTPSKSKLSPNAGFTAQWHFAKNLSLQTGAAYITKGTGKGQDIVDEPQNINYFAIHYIDVPLNLVYTPGNGHFFTGAGVYYAFALKAREQLSDGNYFNVALLNYQYNKGLVETARAIKPADAGVGVLAGYNINSHLYIKLNAQWGLKNISTRYDGFFHNEGSSYKTASYAFNVGYRF